MVAFDQLATLELRQSRLDAYDRPIGVRLLFRDPSSGAEHYLVRYPPGLQAQPHQHSTAHTFVVLEGALEANGRRVGPGSYCHFPARTVMHHAPAGEGGCLLVAIFDGPQDILAVAGSAPVGRAVAVESHVVSERPPLTVSPGIVVTVGRRDDEWPAFVFVESADGAGWIPSRYLSADSGRATATHAYETTELATTVGEVLEILVPDDESGWHWCRAADGRVGWVPTRTLRPASEW
jgi:quercetin dioxygenase-like cupin family protein